MTLTNIIESFYGTNPGARKILLAAHWDTRPRAERDPDPEKRNDPIPGANDGASGIAVLLEMGRIFAEHPPPVPVDIVLFDGEDYGKQGERQNYLLGARHFAGNVRSQQYKFGILIDMVGDKRARFVKEGYSNTMLPEIVETVWRRARSLNLSEFINKTGPEIFDDHQPLIQVGVPIINIMQVELVNRDYWHTTEDTVDKCSPRSLETVGRLLTSLVYEGL